MKKIPYGIANFEQIILDDYYFIDKSKFIRVTEEQNPFILLTRPRRMGKSLFTNMLMSYYDIAKKDRFQDLFGNLWIGQHPTKLANKFVVLKFDFSQVDYSTDSLAKNFTLYCMSQLKFFFDNYSGIFTKEERDYVLSCTLVKEAINALVTTTHLKGLPIYLFIDEYDNFTNTVLTAKGIEGHRAITHGDGFYRDFFKCCKGTFERVFMTGVTPVSYDDMNSGFSIADVVSLNPKFNHAIGVTEDELRQMIGYYRSEGRISRDTDTIVAEMKPWYDNFCFAEDCFNTMSTVYNTDMVLKYIRTILDGDSTPKVMVGYSGRTDTNKLDYLVIADDLSNRKERQEIISEICARGYTTGNVAVQFPAREVGLPDNFKSMLFYYGTLTFGGWDYRGNTILAITNKTMGELYLQYMLRLSKVPEMDSRRKSLDEAVSIAAIDGKWQPMVEEIGKIYHDYTSVRNSKGGEYDVQGFLRGLLCLNAYFDVWPELELGHGYNDILLLPKGTPRCPTRHSYALELKHIRANDQNVDTVIAEASRQLNQYVSDIHLASSPLLKGSDLTKVYIVFQGHDMLTYGVV